MRVSLFGGGTDIPSYFKEYGGSVLSFSINKYSYVTLRKLPPYFNHTIRLTYSRMETCSNVDDIIHPLIRVALKEADLNNIELHHDSDVPGKSGLGSSSSFGVAMSLAISALNHSYSSASELAKTVINWERNILNEAGGYQDQIASAYGGINKIIFTRSGDFHVHPIPLSNDIVNKLLERLLLVYIPLERFSYNHSISNHISSPTTKNILSQIQDTVPIGSDLLLSGNIDEIGSLLDYTWQLKRQLRDVCNETIDGIYALAKAHGAIGGKLLGAGGGGFMLLIAADGRQQSIRTALSNLLFVPFNVDFAGARILHFSP